MAEEYVVKTKEVDGKVIETKYRVDPGFVPEKIAEISMEFIENYCVANSEIDWLIKTINITEYEVVRNAGKPDQKTETVKCDNYPFVNIRRDFVKKFFPKIIKGKQSNETWKDRINRLYGNK